MLFALLYLLSGYLAYLLFMRKQVLIQEDDAQINALIIYLLTGFFGLGYVIGKYYKK